MMDRGAETAQSAPQTGTNTLAAPQASVQPTNAHAGPSKPAHTIRKLLPPRPFPTVPTSVSATGPRSAHTEGKNNICITRKTPLGAYLRRCKDVFMKDGYRTLHLSAMGAAIPHLMQLALSIPEILPFPQDEVRTEVFTGTVEVNDELIPEDEDEDITYRSRGKSSVSVVIIVGDGVDEPMGPGKSKSKRRRPTNIIAAAGGKPSLGRTRRTKGNGREGGPERTATTSKEKELP